MKPEIIIKICVKTATEDFTDELLCIDEAIGTLEFIQKELGNDRNIKDIYEEIEMRGI